MGATPWRFKSSHPHSQIRRIRGSVVAQSMPEQQEQPEQWMLDDRFGLAEVVSENLKKFRDPKKGRRS